MLSPDGKFAYVGGDSFQTLIMRRSRSTGALSQLPGTDGCIEAEGSPTPSAGCVGVQGVLYAAPVTAISADGRTAYAAAEIAQHAYFAPTVVGFDRNPSTGALTQFTDPPVCIPSTALNKCLAYSNLFGYGPIVSHDGRNVYLRLGGGIWTLTRDAASGALTPLPDPIGCVRDPHFLVPLALGCATVRGVYGPTGIVESPDGRNVYVVSPGESAIAVFRRDPAQGYLVQLPGKAGCVASGGMAGACARARGLDEPVAIAISKDGRSVYTVASHRTTVSAPMSHALAVFRRNPRTGALKQLPGPAGCVSRRGLGGCAPGTALFGARGVAVSPDGRSVYVASTFDQGVAVFARNPRSGDVTQVAGAAGCETADGTTRLGGVCTRARIGAATVVLVSPDNRNVYVGSQRQRGEIAIFHRAR